MSYNKYGGGGGRGGVDSVVGIATRCRLEEYGFESSVCKMFLLSPYLSRPTQGSTQSPVQLVTRSFPENKGARAWNSPPSPSSAEVKNE